MSEVEVTEYETVAKTETKYECKHCEFLFDEDEVTTVLMDKGHLDVRSVRLNDLDEKFHLCEGCSGLRRAHDIRAKRKKLKERWEGIANRATTGALWLLVPIAICLGYIGAYIGGIVSPDEGPASLVLTEAMIGGWVALLALLFGGMLTYELFGQRNAWPN